MGSGQGLAPRRPTANAQTVIAKAGSMYSSKSASLQDILEKRILQQFGSKNWKSEEVRRSIYDEINRALMNAAAALRAAGNALPFDVSESTLRAIAARVEKAAKDAASLDQVNAALQGMNALQENPADADGANNMAQNYSSVSEVDQNAGLPTKDVRNTMVPPFETARRAQSPLLIAIAVAVAILAGLQTWTLWPKPAPDCGPRSKVCLDTGWVRATNAKTSVYFYRHGLGKVPSRMFVWFSPAADGVPAFLLSGTFAASQAGNPVSIEARPDVIYLHIAAGIPLHGVYNAAKNQWTMYNQGYFRIVATK